jgi:hypothetical protein
MKNLNLVLVLILLACYSGFASRSVYASGPSSNSNCHSMKTEVQAQNQHKSDASVYYSNEHAMNHGASRCCFESLTNAPQNEHLAFKDLRLDASFVNNTSPEINKCRNSSLSISIREHDPPDLYVSNSSLLL